MSLQTNLPYVRSEIPASILLVTMDLVYNVVIFSITLAKTVHILRTKRRQYPGSSALLESLAREGTLYFASVNSFIFLG